MAMTQYRRHNHVLFSQLCGVLDYWLNNPLGLPLKGCETALNKLMLILAASFQGCHKTESAERSGDENDDGDGDGDGDSEGLYGSSNA